MPDYSKGKIYKIIDVNNTKCYIGSTVQTLNERINNHKTNYKRYKNGKCGKVSVYELFDEFGITNCKIELLEEYNCEDKKELETREGKFIKITDCINKRIAGRNKKEYYENNKEEIKEKQKQKVVCECGSEITKHQIVRHRKSKKHLELLENKNKFKK